MARSKLTREAFFWSKVRKTTTCWLWTGHLTRYGHGSINWYGKTIPAHRASWILHYGEIFTGVWVCHQCANRHCVRPCHLRLGSPSDNSGDRKKVRYGTGIVPDELRQLTKRPHTLAEAFWSHVIAGQPEACWPWHGSRDMAGYGRFKFGPTYYKAHRVSYILAHGSLADDLYACHTCPMKGCVNPAHLYAGTPAQNTHDTVQARMHPHGETHYKAKLSEEDVLHIRTIAVRHTIRTLANMYHVDTTCIRYIIQGKTWKHLLPPNYVPPKMRHGNTKIPAYESGL